MKDLSRDVVWRRHRILLIGPEADVDAVVRRVCSRATTAWGPEDAIPLFVRRSMQEGLSGAEALVRLDERLRRDAGLDLSEVLAQMDPDRRIVGLLDQAPPPSPDDDRYDVQITPPGLSLAAAHPVPHSVAQWGLDPVGRLWRADNWGADTDVVPTSTGFEAGTVAGRAARWTEFFASAPMPMAAFQILSRRHREIVFVMTGEVDPSHASPRRRLEGSLAVTSWCAGEHMSTDTTRLGDLPGVAASISVDMDETIWAAVRGYESAFVSSLR